MMGRPGGGMIRGAGMSRPGMGQQPAERTRDLRGTVRRLLARMRPERVRLLTVLALGVTSVGFLVTGPRILGTATNILFDGVVGKQLPAGITKARRSRCCARTARASSPT
jgi:ATP-binding cassette, subfamily B, multidrug efflux pump